MWRLTAYHRSLAGGLFYCGSDIYGSYDPSDPTTAASSGSSKLDCGQRLRITTSDSSIIVIIKDRCPGCDSNHLDLSQAAWERLGSNDYGSVVVVTQTVQLPDVGR